jgi:hypothetical protein
MDAGADPRLRDNAGGSAIAVARANPTAMKLFQDYMARHGKNVDEPPMLSPAGGALLGRHVKLTGLQARPELNGRVGVATEYNADKQRYAVKLSGANGETVSVRPSNLEHDVVLSAACAACGAKGAHRRCTRCLTVYYCNKECQLSNWASHSPTCKAAASLLVAKVPKRPVPHLVPMPHMAKLSKSRNDGAPPPVGKSFTVKVQVPLHVVMQSPRARGLYETLGMALPELPPLPEGMDMDQVNGLLIYNAGRSVKTMMLPRDTGYQGLVDAVINCGHCSQKGYFRASRDEKDTLTLGFGELLPEERW